MKRGDYAALTLFFVQAAYVFHRALLIPPVLPGLGDHYFHIPLSPLSEALSSIRTLGYPLFHALMARGGWGLESYPTFQMMALIPCVFVLWLGLRAYGLTGLAAIAAVSPLLWLVPVEVVMPETLAKCLAIASVGFLLWAAGTRRVVAYLGLAASVFLACQMRPAFLFLVGFLPAAWLFLYTRRWGAFHRPKFLRHAAATGAACTVPLFLFCLLRLALVGHFGLVSFAGQNTAGIAIEMLSPAAIARLPMEDRPLALLLERARIAWPADRFLTARGASPDWPATTTQYAANVNRIARTVQARFPITDGGSNNVVQDKQLSRLSLNVFRAEFPMYAAWLRAAAVEAARVTVTLLLGGDHDFGFGLGPSVSLSLLLLLGLIALCSWPLERRAFGEGSRAHFARAATVVCFIAGLFLGLKMLLVILVEPPIARYVQAAAFLLPCAIAALYWDRLVVLAAGLLRRPQWYSQCYVAYPPVPYLPAPLPWRMALAWNAPTRRGLALTVALVVACAMAAWWTTRDNRLFAGLRHDPDAIREFLLADAPPVHWRDGHGATLLHYAALYGDAELATHLLAAETEPNDTTDNGASALHWAVMGDENAATIPLLLSAGLSADSPGPLQLTPVHLAALSGNVPALEALLASGADPDRKTSAGVSPLHIVQSVAAAEVLLTNGAATDTRDSVNTTPFMWAHTRELAGWLLAHGADVNARENWRTFIRECTPLHKAVYQGDLETARWLLDNGADPNAGDLSSFSPLFYAIWRNDGSLLALLLERGADPNHPGQWLAFDRDRLDDRFTDIFAKTIGRHPERDALGRDVPDKAPIRPLDWAAFLGRADLAAALLAAGAHPNAPEAGRDPLAWAALGNQHKFARLLRGMIARSAVQEEPSPFQPMPTSEEPVRTPDAAATTQANDDLRAGLRAALETEARALQAGDPNVLETADGFLFTRQACIYMLEQDFLHAIPGDPASGPSPALAVILDIHRQLRDRGIHLIVLPAPIALEVHPEAFYQPWDPQVPAQPARAAFIQALRDAGVDAIDVLPGFLAYRGQHPEEALYLKEDGHWNSIAIALAADALAETIRALPLDLGLEATVYRLASLRHQVGLTHIAARLPEDRHDAYRDTVWDVTRVLHEDDTPYTDSEGSPVLVAGDSYTLILQELAGHLSAHLAAALGRPVASYHGLAAGPIIPRVLARKGKAYIDTRKVIVWVFSASYIRPQGKDQWGPLELP